jgi:peptide/nickel transport system substrate-binding protein
MAFAADLPKEKSAAEALQQVLSRAGITVTLLGYPSGTFFSNFAGVPDYVHQHDLGLAFGAWGRTGPTGTASCTTWSPVPPLRRPGIPTSASSTTPW